MVLNKSHWPATRTYPFGPASTHIQHTGKLAEQEGLQHELAQMQERFKDAKPRDLRRFLMGYGGKADKAIPAYEAHLQW